MGKENKNNQQKAMTQNIDLTEWIKANNFKMPKKKKVNPKHKKTLKYSK